MENFENMQALSFACIGRKDNLNDEESIASILPIQSKLTERESNGE